MDAKIESVLNMINDDYGYERLSVDTDRDGWYELFDYTYSTGPITEGYDLDIIARLELIAKENGVCLD
jgi:hypothetical protein